MTWLLLAAVLGQTGPRWSLTWSAPEDCAGAEQLQAGVEHALGRPLFGEHAAYTISGKTERAGELWVASLTLVDARGAVLGSRDVSTSEPSCTALFDRLVFVIGLLVKSAPGELVVSARPAVAPSLPDLGPLSVPAPPRPREVRVHLVADAPSAKVVRLVESGLDPLRGNSSATTDVCVQPCDEVVPFGSRVYVTGPGLVPSRLLTLTAVEVTLRAKLATWSARFPFVLATSFGVAAAVGGLVSVLVGGLLKQPVSMGLGAGLAGVGIGLILGGAWGLSNNATEVSIDPP